MPVAHAQAMLPDLKVVDGRPDDDAVALERLAAWCLRLSPMTAADPPDCVWMDVTGCAHLHGGERSMLDLLLEHLGNQGFAGRAAAADTPGAAHAVARHGGEKVLVVPSDTHVDAMALLPVASSRIGPEIADGLRRLGFDLVGQLATTARGPLARRFGDGLLLRLDQALGRVHEPVQPVMPPEVVSVRRTFVEPLSTAEAFATVIPMLVSEACAVLERRGQGVRRLDLVYERVNATIQVIQVGTARPVRDVGHLGRLLDERIEDVDPGPGVEAMRLVLPLVEALSYAQPATDLAGDRAGEADLSELVDRLTNRLGPGKVYRLQPVESDVPERSQTPVPALPASDHRTALARPSRWPRPVRLLERPEPVQAMSMMPDHPPRAFTWRRVRHQVRWADGLERIHGEWWRRPGELAAVRDYWAVENEEGRRFWLFRQGDGVDPATGALSWFLHGFF